MDTEERIFKLLDEMSKDLGSINVKLATMNKDIDQNTKDLSAHIEGVMQNRARIARLEAPKEMWATIRIWTAWISGIALVGVSMYGILK